MTPVLHRPEPVLRHGARPVDRSTAPAQAAARLSGGELLRVTDRYGTGVAILAQLRALLPPEGSDYGARRARERAHREAALRLLVPIVDHRLALADGRSSGFLRLLYPELPTFDLPLVQAQELYGAWRRYRDGVYLAVLGHPVHPFYGTYAPTRSDHLELFGTWLSQHQGPRGRAIDVGTGCGVLALMLSRAGFERVLATDNNPNAIESVRQELHGLPVSLQIALRCCDLLGGGGAMADLIVFNPPWIQGAGAELLESALYFEEGLFERFFEQALARLRPRGRVVLVFSSVLQLVQPDVPHPILAELERGRLRLIQKLHRKVKPLPGKSGQRRRTRERVEIWELGR